MTARIDYHIAPGGRLSGRVRVPGDKSISHRSVMLGALAEGITEVSGLLAGEDVLATLAAFRAMGVEVEEAADDFAHARRLRIHGVGLHGLRKPKQALDMGNSGTAMRLLAGILAGQAFDSDLTGDSSLCRRPMTRVAAPLNAMGGEVVTTPGGLPPLKIRGGRRLHGREYVLPVASAQVKSALLLAGLYAEGETTVIEPAPTRDHTERMLRGFDYPVETRGNRIRLHGGGRLRAGAVAVPADISSAAFFLVGAAITPGAEVVLEQVGVNPTRTGVLHILRKMGVRIDLENQREVSGEPVADLRVRASTLHGIVIPPDQVPLAIDEFPALFIAAACADGQTVLTGAKELRVKESDRIAVMAQGLRTLSVETRELPDGIVITGGALGGGSIDSQGDHRIAMSFALAGLRARAPVHVRDCKNVDTSFPGFVPLAAQAGLKIEERKA